MVRSIPLQYLNYGIMETQYTKRTKGNAALLACEIHKYVAGSNRLLETKTPADDT